MEEIYNKVNSIPIWKTALDKMEILNKIEEQLFIPIREKIEKIIISENNLDITKTSILDKIIKIIIDIIANSINAESSEIKLKLKYDKKNNDIIIWISDNWFWNNAEDNNDIFTSIWWSGSLIKALIVLSEKRTRLIRGEKWASIITKINLYKFEKLFNNEYIEEIMREWKIQNNKKSIRMNNLYEKVINDIYMSLENSWCSEEIIESIISDFVENKIWLLKNEKDFKKRKNNF
jgi:hypothetical protein